MVNWDYENLDTMAGTRINILVALLVFIYSKLEIINSNLYFSIPFQILIILLGLYSVTKYLSGCIDKREPDNNIKISTFKGKLRRVFITDLQYPVSFIVNTFLVRFYLSFIDGSLHYIWGMYLLIVFVFINISLSLRNIALSGR